MGVSRRSFLGTLGVGATAAAVAPQLAFSFEPRKGGAPGVAQLNANENAYGCFASVRATMQQALQRSNRYPDTEVDSFLERVAALHQVKREQVLLGNGSAEILRLTAEAFTGPGRKLITALPTFEAPAFYARARGAEVMEVPLLADFAHDLDAMLTKAGGQPALIYICNPNNPTASLTPRREIEALVKKLPSHTYVLIDEAYHHFADAPEYRSFLDAPVDDPRVIVTRTFSKVYGMAGLRLGYGVTAPATARRMFQLGVWDNANVVALQCGMAALDDAAGLRTAVERNRRDRAEFLRQASARRLRTVPSQANFVMLETGRPIRELQEYFKARDVLIGRPFPRMESWARISLGTPEEMAKFWQVWDAMPAAARN